MKYRVIITSEAENDLRKVYRYIRQQGASQAARAWLTGARRKIKTLAENPERAHLAPESTSFEEPIRELFYGSGNRGNLSHPFRHHRHLGIHLACQAWIDVAFEARGSLSRVSRIHVLHCSVQENRNITLSLPRELLRRIKRSVARYRRPLHLVPRRTA